MAARKLMALAFLAVVLSPLLFPQSLAEIAQKERERRAALKGKKGAIITNASLAKLKKKPALETPAAPPAPVTEEVVSPEAAPEAAAGSQEPRAAALPASENPVPPALK